MFLYDTILFQRCTLRCHAIFQFSLGRMSVYLCMSFMWKVADLCFFGEFRAFFGATACMPYVCGLVAAFLSLLFFFFFFSLSHFHRICPDICVSYSFIILRQYLFYSLQCFFFGSLLEAVLVEISALRSLDVTSLCQPQFLMKFLSRQLHGSAVEVAYTADVLSVRKASVLLRWPPAGIGMHETKYGR